jgi:hypothetical protein
MKSRNGSSWCNPVRHPCGLATQLCVAPVCRLTNPRGELVSRTHLEPRAPAGSRSSDLYSVGAAQRLAAKVVCGQLNAEESQPNTEGAGPGVAKISRSTRSRATVGRPAPMRVLLGVFEERVRAPQYPNCHRPRRCCRTIRSRRPRLHRRQRPLPRSH